jgi:hypothetical protein
MLAVNPVPSDGLSRAQADVTLCLGGSIPHLKAQPFTTSRGEIIEDADGRACWAWQLCKASRQSQTVPAGLKTIMWQRAALAAMVALLMVGTAHGLMGMTPQACPLLLAARCALHVLGQAQALRDSFHICAQTSQPPSDIVGPSNGGQAGPEAAGYSDEVTGVLEDTVLLDVSGMHCASCSGRVRRLLEAQPHVAAATVSLATETALVRIAIPHAHSSAAGAAGASLILPACLDALPP